MGSGLLSLRINTLSVDNVTFASYSRFFSSINFVFPQNVPVSTLTLLFLGVHVWANFVCNIHHLEIETFTHDRTKTSEGAAFSQVANLKT